MKTRAREVLAALAILLGPSGASAGDVELAPFAGFQFGGSVDSNLDGRSFGFGAGLDYGATLNVKVAEGWRVELFYSRQDSDLSSRGSERLGMDVQRYMLGIQEEKGAERTRFFGVFLLGATRFAPRSLGYDSEYFLTGAVGLGIKQALSSRLGLRAEARGFYVRVDSDSGVVCTGSCLYVFRTTGMWQGDVSAGVTFRF